MLDVLRQVEEALPGLLADSTAWNSLLIDYDHPHVWRLWQQFGEHRLLLHKIFPCEEDAALFHPHPWPSAVKVFDPQPGGGYETAIGYGDAKGNPPAEAARFRLFGPTVYEMTNRWSWHLVRPFTHPSYSLMVAGQPYGGQKQKRFGQLREHKSLDEAQKADLFGFFRKVYTPEG